MAHRLFMIPVVALLAQGALAASPVRGTQASGSVATATITVGLSGDLVIPTRLPEATPDAAAKARLFTPL